MKKFYETYFRLRDRLRQNRFLAGIASLGWLVAFVFAIKTSVLDANNIPSPSMEPTLMIGDFLFVNKMRYTFDLPYTNIHLLRLAYPERGDIVTFTPPQDSASFLNKTLVKRVVGVPGDTIEVNDHEITVSGKKYSVKKTENAALLKTLHDENIANSFDLYLEDMVDPSTDRLVRQHYIMKRKGNSGNNDRMATPGRKWVIPPRKYLMMGDNRDRSLDGRACEMVETKNRKACQDFDACRYDVLTGNKTEQQCILTYAQGDGPTWGLIDADKIHGKVYLSYLSVNWGTGTNNEQNPIVNLMKTITGDFTGVYVRWERTFRRIY